jgi:N-methylhydantoinase B/oxoprolinase/acetone carboxylase alpha subunit
MEISIPRRSANAAPLWKQWADGVYEADNTSMRRAREPLVHIHASDRSGSDMVIDFTGTQPQTSGNNN